MASWRDDTPRSLFGFAPGQLSLLGPPVPATRARRQAPSQEARARRVRADRAARAAAQAAVLAAHYPDDSRRPCVGCSAGCEPGRCATFGF